MEKEAYKKYVFEELVEFDKTTYKFVVDTWNLGADVYNQWDSLDEEEKILFALYLHGVCK